MKRCPKCDFSFADFHHVCDFDGTDLIDDPETLPVSPGVSALVAATQSPFLGLVKSPTVLIVLALAGLVSSALLIGYYDSANQANSIAESPTAPHSPDSRDSISNLVPLAQLPTRPSAQPPTQPSVPITTRSPSPSSNEVRRRSDLSIPKPAKDLSPPRERSITASRSRARPRPPVRNQQSKPELALQQQPKGKPPQEESKESALQRDAKENANRKESKLTATLKATWNILKKPFKF